jgi:serine/threonine protein kinase
MSSIVYHKDLYSTLIANKKLKELPSVGFPHGYTTANSYIRIATPSVPITPNSPLASVYKIYLSHNSNQQATDLISELSILETLRFAKQNLHVPEVRSYGENFIELPYYPGDLAHLQRTMHFTINDVRTIGCQVSSALKDAHSMGVIHADIKPGNIFVEKKGERYLMGDWGAAFGFSSCSRKGVRYAQVTTPIYRAPEVSLHKVDCTKYLIYTEKIDVWSLGITLLELYLNKPNLMASLKRPTCTIKFPNLHRTEAHTLASIFDLCGMTDYDDQHLDPNASQKGLKEYLKDADPEFSDLMLGMLRFNPSERITMEQVYLHPFFYSEYLKEPPKSSLVSHFFNVEKPLKFVAPVRSENLRRAIVIAFQHNMNEFHPSIVFKVVHLLRHIASSTNFLGTTCLVSGWLEDFVRSLYNLVLCIFDTTVPAFDVSELFSKTDLLSITEAHMFAPTEYDYFQHCSLSMGFDMKFIVVYMGYTMMELFNEGYLYEELLKTSLQTLDAIHHPKKQNLLELKNAKKKLTEPIFKKRRN